MTVADPSDTPISSPPGDTVGSEVKEEVVADKLMRLSPVCPRCREARMEEVATVPGRLKCTVASCGFTVDLAPTSSPGIFKFRKIL